jgi:hypothetical protein
MRDERFEVTVTFDPAKGYVASAPELRSPVVALSLGGLRPKIEVLMLPDDVDVILQLDGLAERERHRSRRRPQKRPPSMRRAHKLATAWSATRTAW